MQNTITRRHVCASNLSGTCNECHNEALRARLALLRSKPLHSLNAAQRAILSQDATRAYTVVLRWLAPKVADVRMVVADPKGIKGDWIEAKRATQARLRATRTAGTPDGFNAALLTFSQAEGIAADASRFLAPAPGQVIRPRRRRRG